MTLRHVRRGEAITAAGWNEMVDRLNIADDRGDGPGMTGTEITITNSIFGDIPAGTVVPINPYLRKFDMGPDRCFQLYQEHGFQLLMNNGGDFFAVTKEAITYSKDAALSHIPHGAAEVPFRMVAAFVYSDNDNRYKISRAKVTIPSTFPNTPMLFAEDNSGDWDVVAQSWAEQGSFGDYAYKRFCYLTKARGISVTYYDRTGASKTAATVRRLVFPSAFVGRVVDGDPSVIEITPRSS